MSTPEKVEIRHGESTMNVAPEFYGVAFGIMALGFHAADVFRDEGGISIVFLDYDDLQPFSDFLVQHELFKDENGEASVNGHFSMSLVDGGLRDCTEPIFFVDVPDDQLKALEGCLVSHVPSQAGSPS